MLSQLRMQRPGSGRDIFGDRSRQGRGSTPYQTLDGLPIDVLERLCHFMDARSVVAVSCTCKVLQNVCNAPGVWADLLLQSFLPEELPIDMSFLDSRSTSHLRAQYRRLSLQRPAFLSDAPRTTEVLEHAGSQFRKVLHIDGRRDLNFTTVFRRIQPGHYNVVLRVLLQPGYVRGYCNFRTVFSRPADLYAACKPSKTPSSSTNKHASSSSAAAAAAGLRARSLCSSSVSSDDSSNNSSTNRAGSVARRFRSRIAGFVSSQQQQRQQDTAAMQPPVKRRLPRRVIRWLPPCMRGSATSAVAPHPSSASSFSEVAEVKDWEEANAPGGVLQRSPQGSRAQAEASAGTVAASAAVAVEAGEEVLGDVSTGSGGGSGRGSTRAQPRVPSLDARPHPGEASRPQLAGSCAHLPRETEQLPGLPQPHPHPHPHPLNPLQDLSPPPPALQHEEIQPMPQPQPALHPNPYHPAAAAAAAAAAPPPEPHAQLHAAMGHLASASAKRDAALAAAAAGGPRYVPRWLAPLYGSSDSAWRQLDPAGPLGPAGGWRTLHLGALRVRRAADVHLHCVMVQLAPGNEAQAAAALPVGEARWRGTLVDFVELVPARPPGLLAGLLPGCMAGGGAPVVPEMAEVVVLPGL